MDVITSLLSGPKAEDAFLVHVVFSPPWSLRVEDGAPLTIVAVFAGELHVHTDTGDAANLTPGDVAILRGPGFYTIDDGVGTEPQVVVLQGQICVPADRSAPMVATGLGTRRWGNDEQGTTSMVTGTYTMRGDVSERLLRALPELVVVRVNDRTTPMVGMLAAEAALDLPGQGAVLDRLVDLLLISALRVWFETAGAAPAWYAALGDPAIGVAVRAIHDDPAEAWTVERLAKLASLSRAAFARRFSELVGEPPLSFITGLRMALAADLLRETNATIASIAADVGYANAFGFSAAFSRERGLSPHAYRVAELASTAERGTGT